MSAGHHWKNLTRSVRLAAEYFAVRALVCIIQALPLEWTPRMANVLAWLAWDVFGVRRTTTLENLQSVFPEWTSDRCDQTAREMWAHLVLMLCEIAHAPRRIHETNWREFIHIRDDRLMTGYFLDWRPVVLVSGHLGNFELAIFATGILGIPTWAIARTLDNPWLQGWISRFREQRGQYILPASGSAAEVQRVLDAGGMLSLLGDQHAGQKGCWVDFMGRPASCHKAVALFTLAGNAPMLVSYAVRRGAPLQLEVGCVGVADPLCLSPEQSDVRSLTQWYNRRLEEVVRHFPEQYWWLHRRWKERPQRRGSKARVRANPTEPRAA